MRVRVERLVRSYAGPTARVLDGLELELSGAGVHALIGANGSGKTTLLRTLALLDPPDEGEVRFDDATAARGGEAPVRPDGATRRRVAMVFDRPALLRGTVRWNLEFALRARGVGPRERSARVAAVVEPLELGRLLEAPVDRISAGEARRTALARGLALRTELLLLDEPTANLDPFSAKVVERVVRELAARGEATVLLATHDLGHARRLASRVHFLDGGRIAATGETAEILDAPEPASLRAFVDGGTSR